MPRPRTNPVTASLVAKIAPFVAAFLFLATSIAGYTLIVQPELQKYLPGGPLDEAAKRQIVDNRKSYLTGLKGLDTLYTQYGSGDASVIPSILPSAPDLPSIFTSYEQLAKQMGIGLESVDIVSQDTKIKSIPGARQVVISLKFDGVDYTKFKKLLTLLESNSRFTDVMSFDIQPDSQFANFTVQTYYAK